jgi:hypothetical protein
MVEFQRRSDNSGDQFIPEREDFNDTIFNKLPKAGDILNGDRQYIPELVPVKNIVDTPTEKAPGTKTTIPIVLILVIGAVVFFLFKKKGKK